MTRLTILLLFLSVSLCEARPIQYTARAIPPPATGYNDGDTIHVHLLRCLPLPGGERVCGNVRVRLRGIDAPEIGKKAPACERALGMKAKDELEHLLPVGARMTLTNIGREKFGRPLATLITANGVDVAQHLLDMHLVRPSSGQKKQPWCQ